MSYESDNKARYQAACTRAVARSTQTEYKGCSVHVNAQLQMQNGAPVICGYGLSDWSGPETVATYVNGVNRT